MQGKVYTPTDIKAYKTLRTYLMIPTVVVSESSRRSMNQPWTGASPGSTAAAQHRSETSDLRMRRLPRVLSHKEGKNGDVVKTNLLLFLVADAVWWSDSEGRAFARVYQGPI